MRRTPWSKQSSSLPSDRIKPATKPPANASAKNKGKGTHQKLDEPPKSKEVQRLEGLLQCLQKSTGVEKDPKGGCFCLARVHDLSPYTPICHRCGLILCSTNQPHHSCPHCGRNLIVGKVREALLAQLETQIATTIAKEVEEMERTIAEAQREAGAFPQLKGSSGSPSSSQSLSTSHATPVRQTHKVMSLTGGGTGNRRVLVSSYTTTPVTSRPASRTGDAVHEEPTRVPPLPPEPTHANRLPSPSRPCENLLGGAVTYVPPSRADGAGNAEATSSRRRRGNNKWKEKEKDNVVGEANRGS